MTGESPAPLRVLVLGPLRDQLGCATVTIPFPAGGSQESLWLTLREKFPAAGLKNLRLARAEEFLAPADLLHPGDEIALIPPVSGG